MDVPFSGFPHVLEAQQWSRSCLKNFFSRVDHMEKRFRDRSCRDSLRDKTVILIFSEPSTRTSTFLTIAAHNLGANVVDIRDPEHLSSVIKGEPFGEMVRVLSRGLQCGSNGYFGGVIAIRHKQEGIASLVAKESSVPIINAGDGEGQHPTQGLLDVYTIQKTFKRINNLSIAMVGDLKRGRTVRTLSYFLGKFDGVKIFFVSPPCAQMKDDIKDYLRKHDVTFIESTDLREVAPQVDVIYQTRTQTERGSSFDRKDQNLGYFTIDRVILGLMKNHAVIMHPLPKVDEISPEVDDDPRAIYFTEQLDASIITKMALLEMILLHL